MTKLSRKLALGAAALAIGLSAAHASPANIMFVMDASGSMKKDAGNGYSRMDNAKYATARMLTDVDDANRFGLTVFGHRKARACNDIQVVADVGSVDAGFVNQFVQQLEPKGETPIAESVRLAAAGFERFPDQNNQLVVVTDGIEECGGDVCALADDLAAYNVGLKVNVVGLTLNDEQKSLIRCLSDKTGGKFYDAKDGAGLEAAFAQVKQDIAAAPAPKPQVVPVVAKPADNVWFEDNFDGEGLSDQWEVGSENADNYVVEDGSLLVVFPETGKPTQNLPEAENVFKLKKPVPKGDWTMTARIRFAAQTHGEWLRMGLSDGPENSLFASWQLYTYNYSMTQVFLRADKLSKGTPTEFYQNVRAYDNGSIADRNAVFEDEIEALQLKIEKRGRNYTVSGKLEGKADDGWKELQKMTSIRSPGKQFTLVFGNNTNGYGPKGGEGYAEVDYVKVVTN